MCMVAARPVAVPSAPVGRQPFPPTGRRVPALNPAGRVAGAVGCDDGIQQAFFVCVCVCV